MMSGLSIRPCPPGTIPDVKLVEARAYEDSRGYFSEVFKQSVFAAAGLEFEIRQISQSYSVHPGTMRGLHFQTPPHSQAKLVRVLSGAVSDVAVDIRVGSPTYGQWVSATLTAENRTQLFVPYGFAHGFFTLKPDTLVVYAVDNEYAPDHEAGILWNDPDLAIDWPGVASDAVLSEKDRRQPPLADLPRYFVHEG